MPNTSATGGYLTPTSTTGAQGLPLEDFLHDVLAGVSGLPGPVVRPRWQPKPPPIPSRETDWMAFGISERIPDFGSALIHTPAGQGSSELIRHETLRLVISTYGPNAGATMGLLLDGLEIRQNREAMMLVGMSLMEAGPIRYLADLLGKEWVPRQDVVITLRRMIRRTYPILNLLSAQITVSSDTGETSIINVEP